MSVAWLFAVQTVSPSWLISHIYIIFYMCVCVCVCVWWLSVDTRVLKVLDLQGAVIFG